MAEHEALARRLEAAGVGLHKEVVALAPAADAWAQLAAELVAAVAATLAGQVTVVEHIGSTAVPGLLGKPIVDLVAELAPEAEAAAVTSDLEGVGWHHLGDAGAAGGLVFVLCTAEDFRVAHLHVIPNNDVQLRDYRALRDRLRVDPAARAEVERVKRELAARFPSDRNAYTSGKDEVVGRLRGS